MLKWLVLLCAILYAAFLIGGDDHGQMRAGLRDADAPEELATITVTETSATAATAAVKADEQPIIATNLVPMLPKQPVRVLPRTETPAPLPVALTEPAAPENTELRWVNVDRANVRAEARKGASVTGSIEHGESVLVLWTEPNGWARVRVEGDGVDGFVHQSLLTDIDPMAAQLQ